ncbi:MAG: ion transporter [Planctomycetota bacterium]
MTDKLKQIAESQRFQFSVLGVIILAAVIVGLETSPGIVSRYGDQLHLLNEIILWVFVAEAAIKMAEHGTRFWRYCLDPWNVFDFLVIAVCFLPINAQYAAVLRLARVFRALRLVTAVPKLQILVNALINSIPSMSYVGMLLFLLFYVYGVMGVFLFRDNDPVHFQDLPTSMLSLFRVVTQEDWTDVMYIQMFGSDVYAYDNTTGITPKPHGNWWLGMGFFVSFVFLGTMIMLNLFIGVILNSMEEVQKRHEEELALQAAAEGKAEDPPPQQTSAATGEAFTRIADRLDELSSRLDAIQQRLG